MWRILTEGKVFISDKLTGRAGVAILFTVVLSFFQKTIDGRYIEIKGLINGKSLRIASIYVPVTQQDQNTFFNSLPLSHPNHLYVIGGDFNNIVDRGLDNHASTPQSSQSFNAFT